MKIETLPGDPGMRQKRKRVGRGEGSGLGKTSGRGSKGAQSRSGYKHRHGSEGGQMPLHRRVPKRGFYNRFRVEYSIINVDQLNRFDEGANVDFEALYKARLVRKKNQLVKILGDGELKGKRIVEADAFSGSARTKIEAAGGECRLREKKVVETEGDPEPETTE